MEPRKPWLYATLRKSEDVRHLLILFLNDSASTELVQFRDGIESSVDTGTEYEMKQRADNICKLWIEDDGLSWLGKEKFAFEPLSRTIALAKKMGFTRIYDPHLVRKEWPNPNFLGEALLTSWPGMTAKNGGSYLYALDQMKLYAQPKLPPQMEIVDIPSGGSDFANFLLKQQEMLDSIGPFQEFTLSDR